MKDKCPECGKVPQTLAEAVEYAVSKFEEELKGSKIDPLVLLGVGEEEFAVRSHRAAGRQIRNELGLWEDSDLKLDIWNQCTQEERDRYLEWWEEKHQGRNMHADDASHIILSRAFRVLVAKYGEGRSQP